MLEAAPAGTRRFSAAPYYNSPTAGERGREGGRALSAPPRPCPPCGCSPRLNPPPARGAGGTPRAASPPFPPAAERVKEGGTALTVAGVPAGSAVPPGRGTVAFPIAGTRHFSAARRGRRHPSADRRLLRRREAPAGRPRWLRGQSAGGGYGCLLSPAPEVGMAICLSPLRGPARPRPGWRAGSADGTP